MWSRKLEGRSSMSSPAKYYCLLIDMTMLQVNISWKFSEFYVCSLNIVGVTEKSHKSSDTLLTVTEHRFPLLVDTSTGISMYESGKF
jgi:hypothetical protein